MTKLLNQFDVCVNISNVRELNRDLIATYFCCLWENPDSYNFKEETMLLWLQMAADMHRFEEIYLSNCAIKLF